MYRSPRPHDRGGEVEAACGDDVALAGGTTIYGGARGHGYGDGGGSSLPGQELWDFAALARMKLRFFYGMM